jgi:hypothetical protein
MGISGSAENRQTENGVQPFEAGAAFARCGSVDELCRAAHAHLDRHFPDAIACLYLADESGTRLAAAQVCECQRETMPEFRHYECWAICRGTAHLAGSAGDGSTCSHVKGSDDPRWHYLCLPLYSGDRLLGLLHLEHAPRKRGGSRHAAGLHDPAVMRQLSGIADEIVAALNGLAAAGA